MAAPDSITPDSTPTEPRDPINALIVKHRREIDRVKMMDSAGQKEAFRQLGVDPKALEDHYKELEQKSEELRAQDAKAGRKINAVTWTSFAAGGAGMFAFTHKFPVSSKLVRGFAVALAAPAAALAGTFAASRIFANKIRNESKQLDIDARNAFERELAVALENKEREGKILPPATPEQVMETAKATEANALAEPQASAVTEQNRPVTTTVNVPRRDQSFAAQAAADKAAPITIQIRI